MLLLFITKAKKTYKRQDILRLYSQDVKLHEDRKKIWHSEVGTRGRGVPVETSQSKWKS